jgi:hypothetical protein
MQRLTDLGLASYLDKAIARITFDNAHKLVAAGRPPDEAATLACPGAWSEWREYVLARLLEGADTFGHGDAYEPTFPG